ncbi:hypothetical protein U9M48_027677 [Paspalum notatum var. saurae]|uniref:Uncharacterized protein n=1 Tax=Paspalum notatum var. saurae TaxID=547442 RepID=A0AAQ3TZB3_PASNO
MTLSPMVGRPASEVGRPAPEVGRPWGPSPVGHGDLCTSLSGLSSFGMYWRGRGESSDAGVYVVVVSEVMETMALPLLCGEGGAMAEF